MNILEITFDIVNGQMIKNGDLNLCLRDNCKEKRTNAAYCEKHTKDFAEHCKADRESIR